MTEEKDERISDEEYETIQHQIRTIAALMMDLKISGCVDRQSTADAMAPLFNPTLYRAAGDRFQRLTAAALEFQQEVLACHEEFEKLGPPPTQEQIDAFRTIGKMMGV